MRERYYETELFNLRMKEKKNTTEGRLNIMTYELGKTVHSVYYALRFPDNKNVHLKEAKLELGDLITQIHMLCQELGFEFDDVRSLGLEHIKERYEEFEINGWTKIGETQNER